MKKLVAVILCLALLAGLLCACGKDKELTPKQMFAASSVSMRAVREADCKFDLSLNLPTELLDDDELTAMFGETLSAALSMSGTLSYANKQAAFDVTASAKFGSATASFDFTDVLLDGGSLYMNLHKAVDCVLSLSGMSGSAAYGSMFEHDYFGADLAALSGTDVWAAAPAAPADCPKLTALLARLEPVMDASVKDEFFTAAEGRSTLTMGKADVVSCVSVLLEDIRTNPAEYVDAAIELLTKHPELLDSLDAGVTAAELQAERDSMISSLPVDAAEALAELNNGAAGLPDFTLTASVYYDEAAKTHSLDASVTLAAGGELNIAVRVTASKPAKLTPPSDYITTEELSELGGF